jgi:hypothetical protein
MPNILDIVIVELLMLPECFFNSNELSVHRSIWNVHDSEEHNVSLRAVVSS